MDGRLAEHRRWVRLPLGIPLILKGKVDSQGEFTDRGTALNLSAGGILLATRRYIPPPSFVRVEVPLEQLPPTTLTKHAFKSFHAEVVRVAHSEGWYFLGLRITPPLPS